MKLATYHDGSRDGQLVVVSRDLTLAHYASGVATRLQQVLDDWNFLSPQLEALSQTLNHGKARHAFAFEPANCMAPLPRATQWVAGSAFPHAAARRDGSDPDARTSREQPGPLLRRGASDAFLGARDDIVCASVEHGIDFEAGIAAVTGDLACGTAAEAAIDGIRLLMLANDVALRHLEPAEHAQGAGPLHSRPATAFSPVAVTPDELLQAWRGGRVHLNLESTWNTRRVGLCDAGEATGFHFGQLIAGLCRTRSVGAGSIVGSGPVRHGDGSRGHSCLADKRASEAADGGVPKTGFLQFGDTVRIAMKGLDGQSVFGAIEQQVVQSGARGAALPARQTAEPARAT